MAFFRAVEEDRRRWILEEANGINDSGQIIAHGFDGFASDGYRALLLTPVGDDGSSPNPIPLPPGVWVGLVVLGGIIGRQVVRRRKAPR